MRVESSTNVGLNDPKVLFAEPAKGFSREILSKDQTVKILSMMLYQQNGLILKLVRIAVRIIRKLWMFRLKFYPTTFLGEKNGSLAFPPENANEREYSQEV
ncbi:hypothetical protein [Pseudothermotoga thermarum]|uniref:Uncharacterized protein n=1 Tax=Pseudothermotoga thermarum DSM 5069 TaxID=688269 RepID=F7YV46_9THEM|nr:hypothetical protein [Pseudothermotoga thermarum]AEH50345.1 hypothetical protein Theth_0245 [Pseudothermotoga thermarum DSM 5069]